MKVPAPSDLPVLDVDRRHLGFAHNWQRHAGHFDPGGVVQMGKARGEGYSQGLLAAVRVHSVAGPIVQMKTLNVVEGFKRQDERDSWRLA